MTVTAEPVNHARQFTTRATAGLVLLSLAQFLIALDYSVVYVALPSIGTDLQMPESQLQWVISAYAVLFAGFLLLGGRLGDRYGPRRVFIGAVVWFGIASLVGGLAWNSEVLLLARGAQGLGAALMQPAIIALITLTFRAGSERNRALAVWGTIGASGLAAGAILGGVLTTASWRWTMLINLPLTLLCAFLAPRTLPADRNKEKSTRPLSALGGILATAATLSIVLAMTFAGTDGWGAPVTLVYSALGAVLLLAFVHHERTGGSPMIAPRLRRHRWLLLGAFATSMYMASVGAEFFVVTLLLQRVYELTPLMAGLGFLPLAAMIVLGNMLAGRLAGRLGGPRLLTLAFAIDAIGLLMLAFSTSGENYLLHLLPGLVVSGIGHGMTYTAMFITGTTGVDDADQGTAGAILTTSQYLSAAASLAVLVLVMGETLTTRSYFLAFLTTAAFAVAGAVVTAVVGPRLDRTVR